MTSPYTMTKSAARDRRRRCNEGSRKRSNVGRFASGGPIVSTNTVVDPSNATMVRSNDSTRTNRGRTAGGTSMPCETFASCYMEVCKQHGVRPLPVICVTLPHSLDLTTDRVKMDDWGPILNCLSVDRSLKSVSVRSRNKCRKPVEDNEDARKVACTGKKHREPVFLTRYILEWLSHSVAQCLTNSKSLTRLELEGVPFPNDCLTALCVGLAATASLRHLSLRRSRIGDNGCELVCRTIADVRTLRCLDLSECDLSEKCATALASALSRQKLSLYHETWKESLRYREPDLEAMPGLRRLTLNGNFRFGDAAVSELVEAVRDSLWLKALDLQHCGLTDSIGEEIIHLLEHNTTLAIVDVRMNPNLSEETVDRIVRTLETNGGNASINGKSSYVWMSLNRHDRRTVVSAGAITKNRGDNVSNNRSDIRADSSLRARPKTACVVRKTPKSCGIDDRIAGGTKISNAAEVASTKKAISSLISEAQGRPNNNENDDEKCGNAAEPKISVCVDLRSSFEPSDVTATPTAGRTDRTDDDYPDKSHQHRDERSTAREDNATKEEEEEDEVNKILRQLSEARLEQERLIEERRKTDVILAEERIRRETAESKLRRTKENLSDLEKALRDKERETRGFLLVSQRSLDEIATSFDRLLEMIEDTVTRKLRRGENDDADGSPERAETTRYNEDAYSNARAEIRTRVAHLIRKTKSESDGKRGLRIEREQTGVIESSSSRDAAIVAKFARSEGDVTNNGNQVLSSIVRPIRLERNIGDSPDVVSSETRENRLALANHNEHSGKREKISECGTPCERARAIFARIVNGDAIVHLDGAHGS